jgi:hypothetical protein
MFHGIFLMMIEALDAPWSTVLAVLYAMIVSVLIIFFNKMNFLTLSLPLLVSLLTMEEKQINNG